VFPSPTDFFSRLGGAQGSGGGRGAA
jgi:hypothetical protein